MAYPTDTTLQLPGQANAAYGGTGVDALYLKLYAGEVAAAYEKKLVALPFTQNFTIRGGKSIQLPFFGKATAAHQGNGVNILAAPTTFMAAIPGGEKLLYADKTLVTANMISEWDEIASHFSHRSIYAATMGAALATISDNLVMRCAVLGSRIAANALYTGHPGGNKVLTGALTAATLIQGISDLKVAFDTKDVPKEGRVLVLKPANMQLLVNNRDLINFDYVGRENGNLREGVVARAFGFDLVESTNMPATDLSADTAANFNTNEVGALGNDYAVDCSTVHAIAFQRQGVVSATARGMKLETKYFPEFSSTFVKASHIMGFTWWRPEACGVLQTA